jgi:hypothetical protein
LPLHPVGHFGPPDVSFFGRSVAGFFLMPSYFASFGSFLPCHWSHLGFFIVRLPEVTSGFRLALSWARIIIPRHCFNMRDGPNDAENARNLKKCYALGDGERLSKRQWYQGKGPLL